jgi:salicylate hydroxylase
MAAATPILVVGGGIGGLTTALALAARGRRVRVLEKAAEFGEIGAGLQLAPNAMHVLDRLGLVPEIAKHAVYPSRLVWMDALAGERITAVDLGDKFRRRFGQPYIVLHRGDLLAVLLAACQADPRIMLEAERAVVAVEDLGDRACARCADGSVHDSELLIGADGLWSTVRGAVVDDQPIGSAYVAYRGTIEMARMSSHAGLDNVVMWVGPDMHFVQYPVRRGELYNQVAVFRSPSYRPGHSDGGDDWGGVEEFDAHYAQTCGYVQDCVKLMWRDKRWPMYDRLPIERWARNRIVLMGDAAHPMLQYAAQGACQAIEDALSLANCIAAAPDDAAGALAAYQAARVPRTARVQRAARAIGDYFHLAGAAAAERNQAMRRRAEDDYAPLDWLYGRKV